MRHLLTFLLILFFTVLAFGQNFSQSEPKEDYLKMEYYIHWTGKFCEESRTLFHNPESLVIKYQAYKAGIDSLWQDLKSFQNFLATAHNISYSRQEFNLLLSNCSNLKQLEKKLHKKYAELTAPRKPGLDWSRVAQSTVKITIASAILAGNYINHDWEMDPARNQEFLALSIMVPVTKKFYFTVDHYQGMTASFNYRLIQSFPESGGLTEPLEIWVSGQTVYNGNAIRKIMLGPIVQLRIFSGLHIYSGILGQIYLKKSDLPVNDPEANKNLAPIVGLRFNPFR